VKLFALCSKHQKCLENCCVVRTIATVSAVCGDDPLWQCHLAFTQLERIYGLVVPYRYAQHVEALSKIVYIENEL